MFYRNESDETLVMLTLAGEQRAYEALVTRHQKAVIASALSVTKTRFLAEDAAQDAFVTAWMKLDNLQAPAKFGSWVCRIARNCSLNMLSRYRSFLPLDVVEGFVSVHDGGRNPAEIYEVSEERNEVSGSVEALPEKIRQIIRLHYYEDLSVAEIAERLRLSAGTVKWQLHEGRKRIRKELCALNEKYSDTLVQRVMKKVEELKLWQLQNDKSGFEKVYSQVLREVEDLPECIEKQRALADVLMMGWWWLPGRKQDALFSRIADAALEGKNEEVMAFVVTREDYEINYDVRAEFIRDKQIPRLEKAGFPRIAGREWFWCGYYFYRNGKPEDGAAAYDRAERLLPSDDPFHALVPYAREMEAQLSSRYQDTPKERFVIGCCAQEYRTVDGSLRYWSEEGFGKEAFDDGYLCSVDRNSWKVFRNASCCDGRFFAALRPGESFTGSDGTKLTFLSDAETVQTPAGAFEGCELWETRRLTEAGKRVCRSWYRDGVGIVRQEHIEDGAKTTVLLREYALNGGNGLLPIQAGNVWKYALDCSPDTITSEITATVSFADGRRTLISVWKNMERRKYDEDSWLDAIQEITQEYITEEKNGEYAVHDVSPAIERAERLALTPMEKAHTRAAASVAKRILSTEPSFNPNHTATGHWNFFQRNTVIRNGDSLGLSNSNPRWNFEAKHVGSFGDVETPVLFNDILGILQDAAKAIWSEEWRVGASPIVEYTDYQDIRTQIVCEDGGKITTKAGTFENCLKLRLDISGMTGGWSYRGGKKVYYFAEGIGIVRTENEYCGGARTAVYELTSYEGVGEGYMPAGDGFVRRFEAIGLTDGFVGTTVYTYVADEDGDIILFSDRTGIRQVPPPITLYSAIQGEMIEERLWDEWKFEESSLRHDVNNFHLLCHFFGRHGRYWGVPEKSVAWHRYKLKIMEGMGDGTQVPQAWLGHYAVTIFRLACALFGCEKKEEGYEWLEKAFEAYPKWDAVPDGAEMPVGDPFIYGDIRVVKGRSLILLPDGTKEPVSYSELFKGTSGILYYGMTSPYGWEWFNPARNEDRFREYVQKAKKLTEK